MEKEGGQVCVRVYMHLDVRLCSYASNGDGERERDREGNDKRYYTPITFALGPRVALRAWAIREQAGKQASNQASERANERDRCERRRSTLILIFEGARIWCSLDLPIHTASVCLAIEDIGLVLVRKRDREEFEGTARV